MCDSSPPEKETDDFLCPQNHPLSLITEPERDEERECDECDSPIRKGDNIYNCPRCDFDLCMECKEPYQEKRLRPPQLAFSAHGDTNFGETGCHKLPDKMGSVYFGHMDNFAGVHCMLKAFFSGKLPSERVHIKITWGEEGLTDSGEDFAGAREVAKSLNPQDLVCVIDVTGVTNRKVTQESVRTAGRVEGHIVLEKIMNNSTIILFLRKALGMPTKVDGRPLSKMHHREWFYDLEDGGESEGGDCGFTYEAWHWCGDPQADEDETDMYREKMDNVFFLGVPTCGGLYSTKTKNRAFRKERKTEKKEEEKTRETNKNEEGQGKEKAEREEEQKENIETGKGKEKEIVEENEKGEGRKGHNISRTGKEIEAESECEKNDSEKLLKSEEQENTKEGKEERGKEWEKKREEEQQEKIFRSGGDYNDEMVFCWKKDLDAVSKAIILLSGCFVDTF